MLLLFPTGRKWKKNDGSSETSSQKTHLNRMGRDEMNLAEFPLAVLADRVPHGCKTLVFEDRIWDRSRRRHVPRRLTISASDKFGLPTALDDDVIVGLVQLSKAGRISSIGRCNSAGINWCGCWPGGTRARATSGWKNHSNAGSASTLYYENAWWDNARKKLVDGRVRGFDHAPAWAESRQGSRGPLACYGWCRAFLDSLAGCCRPSDRESHNERADWPSSQSRGRAAGALSQWPLSLADLVGLQEAFRKRCLLQYRRRLIGACILSFGFLEVD